MATMSEIDSSRIHMYMYDYWNCVDEDGIVVFHSPMVSLTKNRNKLENINSSKFDECGIVLYTFLSFSMTAAWSLKNLEYKYVFNRFMNDEHVKMLFIYKIIR